MTAPARSVSLHLLIMSRHTYSVLSIACRHPRLFQQLARTYHR